MMILKRGRKLASHVVDSLLYMTLVVAYDGINFDDTFCFIFLMTNVELYSEQMELKQNNLKRSKLVIE